MRIVFQLNQQALENLIKILEVFLGSGGVIGAYVTFSKMRKRKENNKMKHMQQQIEDLTIQKNAWEMRHDHLRNEHKKIKRHLTLR